MLVAANAAARPPVRFEHLTINDGLPENSVRSILQDSHGYLWFGTQNGVARYDGAGMQVHLPDPNDPRSIGVRFVLAMAEDDSGRIWMGSYATGLSRYDPVGETYTNYPVAPDSLPGPGIAAIQVADDGVWFTSDSGRLHRYRDGRFEVFDVPPFRNVRTNGLTGLQVSARELWVGAAEAGVAVQDRADGSWRVLRHDPDDPTSLPSDYITFIHRDAQGRLWVGSRGGLALHNGKGRFSVFKPQPQLGDAETNYLVCIAQDPAGDMWIGSAVGLYQFRPATGEFHLHAHDPERAESPVKGPVLSVACDRSGIVWAGSWHTGLNKHDPGSSKFDVLLHDPADEGSLDDDAVGAVFEDSRGALWVGTGSRSTGGAHGGLNRRDPGRNDFVRVALPQAPGSVLRAVNDIVEDRGGRLWLGTNRGIWTVDPQTGEASRPPQFQAAPTSAMSSSVNDLAVDGAGRIWAAAWLSGVVRFDPVTAAWTLLTADPADPGALSSDDVTSVAVDETGRVWIGTDSGVLHYYDAERDALRRTPYSGPALEGVLHIIPAGGGRVLVAMGAGVILCDTHAILRSYDSRSGLPSDFTSRIVRDGRGRLWASTARGLARIDETTGEVTVFDERDGLPRNEVHFGVASTQSGRLYFGGHHGLIAFHPDSLRVNAYVPPVHITEIRVLDEPLAVAPDSPLRQSLATAQEIRLGPAQNDISLSFAALDYAHPERNRYRYRLQPYDTDWRNATRVNAAHYTNLDPGVYEFAVMGSNGDGVWNPEPRRLRIVVAPPWWRTGWATAAYVLLVAGAFVLIYRQVINRERMRTALQIERAEASHLHELDQLKSRFFANISHEFRTPLTLLLSPLQRLQEDPSSGSPELFGTMARNARRLARLVDQLLDLSRLEADRMPVRWRRAEWVHYMRAVVSTFTTVAEQKNVVLAAEWPEAPLEAWHDSDLLDTVLVNLVSNALKFTPGGGEVRVKVAVDATEKDHPWPGQADPGARGGRARLMTVTVRNTGSYIPPEELAQVFDRFHQVVEHRDYGDLGSGIGLALVKELAEWCGGRVDVASDQQAGTTFTVELPVYTAPPPEAETRGRPEPPAEAAVDMDRATEAAPGDNDEDEPADTGAPTVLVVEDNLDLRTLLRDELGGEFQVLAAADGRAGLDLARAEIPDLVLSDVMMPKADGFELCGALKSDPITSHVPVILLTARVEADSRKKGLQTGADDYVAKPFDMEELRIRIRNLIEQRRLLAERHAQLEVARPGRTSNPVPSADDRFVARVREIVAENLEDPDFRVEALCKEIGMSRTQLHRKLKAVAGRSAGDFVRVERLNKAAEMLSSGESNVTEVAYSVGYRSLSQFAKAFREQFGMAPSDFEA